MSNLDIVARLQLNAQQFSASMQSALSAFEGAARNSASNAESTFNASFEQIQGIAKKALTLPRTEGGSLNIDVSGYKDAAVAAQNEAAALREVATAAERAAATAGDTSSATRLLVSGYQAAAVEAERHAQAALTEADAMERVQAELNTSASMTRADADALRQNSNHTVNATAAKQMFQHAVRSSVDSLSAGLPLYMIVGEQAERLGEAASLAGGKFKAFGAFMGGPWGIALGVGIAVLAPLVGKLFEGADAADVMKEHQQELATVIDQTTGRIIEQNKALLLNASIISGKDADAAKKAAATAKGKIDSAADPIYVPGSSFGGGGQMIDAEPRIAAAVHQFDQDGSAERLATTLKQIGDQDPRLRKITDTIIAQGAAFVTATRQGQQYDAQVRLETGTAKPGDQRIALGQFGPEKQDLALADAEAKLAAATTNRERAEANATITQIKARKAYEDGTLTWDAYKAAMTAADKVLNAATAHTDKHAASLARDAQSMDVNAQAGFTLADAYLESSSAALIAEARRKALTDATKKGIDVEAQVRRQLDLTVADAVVGGAKQVAQLRDETAARDAVNAKVAAGALPVSKMTQALSAEASLRSLVALRTVVQGDKLVELNKVIDALTAAQAANQRATTSSDAIAAVDDLTRGYQQQVAVQQLQLQGRDAEAAALEREQQLMDQLGVSSQQQLQAVLDTAGVHIDIVSTLQAEAAQQQRINDAIEDQRRELSIYESAVGDAQRTFEQFLTTLQAKPGKAFKDLGKDLAANFTGLQVKLTSEQLFGGLDRQLADFVHGRTGVDQAGKYLATQASSVGDTLKDLAVTVQSVRDQLTGTNSQMVVQALSGDAKKLILDNPDLFPTGRENDPTSADNPTEITVTGIRHLQKAIEDNTGALKTTAETFTNQLGHKFLTNLEKLTGKLPTVVEDAFNGLGTLLKNAGVGATAGTITDDVLGLKSSKLGGELGGAAGGALGTALAGPLGGKIGSIIGGIAGSTIGGLLKKTPHGGSTITVNQFGEASASAGIGNDKKAEAAAVGEAGEVIQSINQVAQALNAQIVPGTNVTVGTYKGNYRVQTDGTHLGGANHGEPDAVDFGDDEQAAIAYAVQVELQKGIITGISAASKKILTSGQDLQTAIEKATLIEAVPKDLKAELDPVGAAIDDLNRKWQDTISALKEGGAGADQMAQAQQLYNLQLQDVKSSTDSASASLKTFLQGLKVGTDSPLSLRDQETAAKSALQPFLDQIAAGQRVDQDKYQSSAQTYLDVERQLYGSTQSYFDAFDQIQQATAKAIATIDNAVPITAAVPDPFTQQTATATQAIADMTEQTNDTLTSINDHLATIASAVGSSPAGFIGSLRGFGAAAA